MNYVALHPILICVLFSPVLINSLNHSKPDKKEKTIELYLNPYDPLTIMASKVWHQIFSIKQPPLPMRPPGNPPPLMASNSSTDYPSSQPLNMTTFSTTSMKPENLEPVPDNPPFIEITTPGNEGQQVSNTTAIGQSSSVTPMTPSIPGLTSTISSVPETSHATSAPATVTPISTASTLEIGASDSENASQISTTNYGDPTQESFTHHETEIETPTTSKTPDLIIPSTLTMPVTNAAATDMPTSTPLMSSISETVGNIASENPVGEMQIMEIEITPSSPTVPSEETISSVNTGESSPTTVTVEENEVTVKPTEQEMEQELVTTAPTLVSEEQIPAEQGQMQMLPQFPNGNFPEQHFPPQNGGQFPPQQGGQFPPHQGGQFPPPQEGHQFPGGQPGPNFPSSQQNLPPLPSGQQQPLPPGLFPDQNFPPPLQGVQQPPPQFPYPGFGESGIHPIPPQGSQGPQFPTGNFPPHAPPPHNLGPTDNPPPPTRPPKNPFASNVAKPLNPHREISTEHPKVGLTEKTFTSRNDSRIFDKELITPTHLPAYGLPPEQKRKLSSLHRIYAVIHGEPLGAEDSNKPKPLWIEKKPHFPEIPKTL